jgi:GTP-binding protein EngB required for normal cell division
VSDGPPLDLGEVLRRSNRDELLPLAGALDLRAKGRGRDLLAQDIEQRLRATGARNPLAVMLLGRSPPAWSVVLAELATRRGVAAHPTVTETERAVLAQWRASEANEAQRAAIARLLSLPESGPTPSDAASRLGPRSQLPLLRPPMLLAVFARVLPFLAPVLAGWVLYRLHRSRSDALLLPAVLELQRLRVLVQRRLVLVLVGPPSSGKDAAMKALFGLDTGGINPVAGSTRTVAVYTAPGDPSIQVVNTPGLGDVLTELTLETREVLDQADLFLFLVNAQGGVRQRERDEFSRCRQRRRPILVVVNKVDTLQESDRERFLADTAAKLQVERAQVVGAAMDPLPQLADSPLGLNAVHDWLSDRLADLGRNPDSLRHLGG